MVRILPAAVLAVSPALLLAVGCAGDSAPLAPTALPEAALSGPAAASVSDAGSSASGSSIRSASSASVTGGPPTGVTAVAVAGHDDRVLVSWTNDASNSAGVKHLVNYASGTCATADWSGAKAWPPTGGDAGRIPAADTSVTVTGLAAGSYCFTVGTYYG